MKRFIAAAALGCMLVCVLPAQAKASKDVVRFAVLDMDRVTAFLVGGAQKAAQDKRDAVQAEIDRREAELAELSAQLEKARVGGEGKDVQTLEAEVNQKAQELQNYYKNVPEKAEAASKSGLSDAQKAQLDAAMQKVAETEGYSLILDRHSKAGMVWYSLSVDITSKVLEQLRK